MQGSDPSAEAGGRRRGRPAAKAVTVSLFRARIDFLRPSHTNIVRFLPADAFCPQIRGKVIE